MKKNLLDWPMPEGSEGAGDDADDPRTTAQLRAELAAANKELTRTKARLEHLEQEHARLAQRLLESSGGRRLELASDPPPTPADDE